MVHFFDTPDLALEQAGVVVRARRTQGKPDDTVVKLRPVVPAELPARLRKLPEFVVEVDAMETGFVCSGSMKGLARRPCAPRRWPRARRCASCSPRSSGRSTRTTRRKA